MQSFSQAGRPEVNSTKQTYFCDFTILIAVATSRSEERRVGKEC